MCDDVVANRIFNIGIGRGGGVNRSQWLLVRGSWDGGGGIVDDTMEEEEAEEEGKGWRGGGIYEYEYGYWYG